MQQTVSAVTTVGLGVLGAQAVGLINPREAGGHSPSRRIREVLDCVYRPTSRRVVASCIDGRSVSSAAGGQAPLERGGACAQDRSPDTAGGTLALWMAVVLNDRDLPLELFLAALRGADIPIGGHTDDHEHSGASGCGANDKLGHILELLSAGPSLARIVELTVGLGIAVSRECVERLSERADALTGSSLLDTPLQRIALLEAYGESVTLCGEHREQAIIINTVPATTLDRLELRERLGEQTAAFNVDLWAFEPSLQQVTAALGLEGLSLKSLLVAMVFYNLATALVLCGPKMPLLLRS